MKPMPKPSEALVYIDNDGSARELTADEKKYVDTEFSPFDGARPYIKRYYLDRNAWGELRGFVKKSEVPDGVPVNPAPPASPQNKTPQGVADAVLDLIRKHRQD